MSSERNNAVRERAWAAAAAVVDPEIPVLTIAELGILRDVKVNDDEVEAVITPTYSGCPAMHAIAIRTMSPGRPIHHTRTRTGYVSTSNITAHNASTSVA